MNKKEFEEKLDNEFGGYTLEDSSEAGRLDYYIESLHEKLVIEDQGMKGITVIFVDRNLRTQMIDSIYLWSDAYDILYSGLNDPKSFEEKKSGGINALLGVQGYDFKWEPWENIFNLDDDTLTYATELLKYGFVKSLNYDPEGRAKIEGYNIACQKPSSVGNGREMILSALKAGNSGRNTKDLPLHLFNWGLNSSDLYVQCSAHGKDGYDCMEKYCIFGVCGYLYYTYRNNQLPQLFAKRSEKRAEYRQPCGPYQFTWEPENGLRYVPESCFQLAMQMVKDGIFLIEEELGSDNHVHVQTSYWLWDKQFYEYKADYEETTLCSLASAEQKLSTYTGSKKRTWIGRYIKSQIINGINNNKEKNALYFCAAYIKYLQDCGQQSKIDEDRAWYREHLKEAEQKTKMKFPFSLSTDLYMDMSDESLGVAELLQERNYVSLYPKMLVDDKKSSYFNIRMAEPLTRDDYPFDDLVKLRENIAQNKIDRSKMGGYTVYSFDHFSKLQQILYLAGYVDYLRRTGQYEEYKERRQEHKKNSAEQFAGFQKENPSLEKVLAIANNAKDSTLYCAIESERGAGEQDIVSQIVQYLGQTGKLDLPKPAYFTFLGMASALTQNNTRRTFTKNQLYVITELREFLYYCDSHNITEGDGTSASYLIDLLGKYQPQTFVIVLGERKYIDHFLELSPQIKFLFSDNVIEISNWSPQKMFDNYIEGLSDEIKEEASQNEEFKEKFLDYVAFNRKYLPLDNKELVDYLAGYANNKNELVLPPDVYRKQSAHEMLQSVIGMDNIKKAAYEFEKYAQFLKRAEMNGMEIPDSSMHMLFMGNPGTGKTMIARVMGQMLYDLGIVKENRITEVVSKDLISEYIGRSSIQTGQIIDKALGGVLFIDEAYALNNGRVSGEEVVTTLIKAMEDYKDRLVIIFAGYEKEMLEFLKINPGLQSRIGYTFYFHDYSADELVQMFDTKMRAAGFDYQNEEILPLVRELCEYFKNKKDFGNGRFIDQLIREVIVTHSQKPTGNENIRILTKDDIPTINDMASTDVIEVRDPEAELINFIGMDNVKQKVRQFAKSVEFQQKAKAAGANVSLGNMHMVFTGNPGTGKTTIARVMADILYSIGVLKTNKIVEVGRKDLVGEHIGQTAPKTSEVIERARDGILFIDEAYSLAATKSGNDYGAEAIDTLLTAMEDYQDSLVVIFAGYREEMRKFIDSNPGLSSRIGYVFDFDDYKPSELTEMFRIKLKKNGFEVEEEALKKATIVFEYFVKKKNFGNGRFVDKLIHETITQHASRLTDDNKGEDQNEEEDLLTIRREDIPEITDLTDTVEKPHEGNLLDSIIGMDKVKEQLKEFESLVNYKIGARDHGMSLPDFNMHMVFLGNPGTGKTTIARIIADKLFSIGVIKENKLIEVERKDLIAQYVGQTAPKVADVIDKALGGVLFIDEAYSLVTNDMYDFGGEAMVTMIKAMEDHKDDLIVIFAGYKKEMRDFINSNPGISSRIGFTFEFEDYTPDELTRIFQTKMKASGFMVAPEAEEAVKKVMEYFVGLPNFGNGRFVDRVIEMTISNRSFRSCEDAYNDIIADDIPTIKQMRQVMMDGQYFVEDEEMSDERKKRTAVHEVGHALLSILLDTERQIVPRISIIGDVNSLGRTYHENIDYNDMTDQSWKARLAVLFGGRNAERLLLGSQCGGCSGDMESAKKFASIMIDKYAMGEYGVTTEQDLLMEADRTATETLTEHRKELEEISNILFEKKEISGEEFKNLHQKYLSV